MDVRDLIRRARDFAERASWAKKILPGPWKWRAVPNGVLVRLVNLGSPCERDLSQEEAMTKVAASGVADLFMEVLVMAELLSDLAGELEKRLPLVDECPNCGNMNEISQFSKCVDCDGGAFPCCGFDCPACSSWLCPDCQEAHECK